MTGLRSLPKAVDWLGKGREAVFAVEDVRPTQGPHSMGVW